MMKVGSADLDFELSRPDHDLKPRMDHSYQTRNERFKQQRSDARDKLRDTHNSLVSIDSGRRQTNASREMPFKPKKPQPVAVNRRDT